MKLNKNSWHYKLWAGSFSDKDRPSSMDLCRYCHRVFWQLFLRAALVFTVGTAAFLFCFGFIYKGLICNTKPTLIMSSILGTLIILMVLYNKWLDSYNKNKAEPKTLVGKWFAARKQKICPMVEFK
jgi:RsiW-degrading membrane proteinase PrsW (M82 family)